jgi:ABC-2 type transport system permease protein
MKSIINIAWKDLLVTFRDRGALALMLLAPFALTLVMAAAFGRGGNPGISDIRVLIVNYDAGEFGDLFVELLQSEQLAELISPSLVTDEEAARAAVDRDEATAVIIIPANLSERIIPTGPATGNAPATLELYLNPGRPISSGVAQALANEFLSQVNAGAAAGQVAVTQLIGQGLISPEQSAVMGRAAGETAGRRATEGRLITVRRQFDGDADAGGFDWLGYMAPSMALLFLMFTVMEGGRSILIERDNGTLSRLLTAPVNTAQVLAGKLFGTYLVGLLQLTILIGASALIFNLRWGSPAGVALTILSVTAAAAGWGALVAAIARSSGQANAVGTALALIFAIGAGNFIARPALPGWLQTISFISPNAWGLEAFTILTAGGQVSDLLPYLAGMWVMALVLFTAAAVAFRRQIA